MSKFNRTPHFIKKSKGNDNLGARDGMLPLHRTVIPGVGFLGGKAVLYRRVPGKALEIYPRSFPNMVRIFLKINAYLVRKKFDQITWTIREFRDNLKAKFHARNSK